MVRREGVSVEYDRQGDVVITFVHQDADEAYRANKEEWHDAFIELIQAMNMPVRSLKFKTLKDYQEGKTCEA
ncbi:hypothetical protein [Macrococcus brunensis]|uniref:hypothetical protein n=1 Tax=Macrococcus brunensis TaxID=198483 RepID=UPI001EF014AE|nr:hypothetical protein [Macrococcus brunensis]ULG71177.1 hypothetical protein MGG12_07435 [Macrococcus brunensis]